MTKVFFCRYAFLLLRELLLYSNIPFDKNVY